MDSVNNATAAAGASIREASPPPPPYFPLITCITLTNLDLSTPLAYATLTTGRSHRISIPI